jgi:hypothetical protein
MKFKIGIKNMVLSVMIIALLVFSGCKSGDNNKAVTKDPFVGGIDGVTLSFEEDAPPAEVYDNGDFPFGVVVKLKNEGEKEVLKDNVLVTISGILASEFDKEEADLKKAPSDDLEATKKDSEGDIIESNPVHVEFDDFNYLSELTGNTPFTIRADVCYKYGTTANSKLCIRENNLDTKEGVCTVTEEKDVFSSGAPIQITEFKESARAKDKVAFTFRVEHKGDGDIYQQATKCDTSTRKYEDKIWVEVDTKMEGLECSGLKDGTASSGYITLYGNDKPITCVQEVSTNSDYETEVVIKLAYDYKDSKQTSILVKHAVN